jgi:hypothetical protein
MTVLVDVNEAWVSLHHIVPGLYDRALLNYLGKLQPGQTVQAEMARENVTLAVRFEVANKGRITFTDQTIPNMAPRSDIHAHHAQADDRIPRLAYYVEEETRPDLSETIIVFHTRKDVEIPDQSGNGNGAVGGDNGRGLVLPPIIYPPAPIDVSDGKVSGGKRGPVDGELEPDSSDSGVTDGGEDEEGPDDHKLAQIAQAIHRGQPVIIAIRGQWKGYDDQQVEILFQRDHQGLPPADIYEPWVTAMGEIVSLSTFYCSDGIPNALLWAQPGTPRDHMIVEVLKFGKGIMVTYTYKGFSAVAMPSLAASYVVPLVRG